MCFPLWLSLCGTLCTYWTCMTASFSIRGIFSCYLFNIFSSPISLSSPSGTPIMWMLLHLVVSQWALKWSLFLFIFFPLICFCGSGISSDVFPLVGLGPGACGIPLGGRNWCLPTGGSWLFGGQGHATGVFRGSLSADGYGCVPTLLLLDLGQPSTGAIECCMGPGLGAKVAILQREHTE